MKKRMTYTHKERSAAREVLNRLGWDHRITKNSIKKFPDMWENFVKGTMQGDGKRARSVLSVVRRDAGHHVVIREGSPVKRNGTLATKINFCPSCGHDLRGLV